VTAHRDIKPKNILKVNNQWKLSDFGAIKEFNYHGVLDDFSFLGTANYLVIFIF